MKWIKDDIFEQYFLRFQDDDSVEERADWYGKVARCRDLKTGVDVAIGEPDAYVGIIYPANEERHTEDSYEEYFPTADDAKIWVELEMRLDGRI
jgi:hypothetical protein